MANCKECKQRRMEQEVATISVFEHESAMARLERCNKRLCIALIASTLALVAVNIIYFVL